MQGFPNGPAGFFQQLQNYAAQAGAGLGGGIHGNPRHYDEYMKAYSVAMLPGKERLNVSYGGKIIMPPSALATLTQMELESPWIFELRNPSNPAASTHAGVLEFIAEEGVVHLPYWMMRTLRLSEGDPIRLTGQTLPKGKFVKIQPQTVDFLEVSDPKAVLEQAFRNFSTLSQGDIIEISYNAITFEILIMEIQPQGAGISLIDTDLEVDFAAPKGYVEPARPPPPPQATMASKLNIDVGGSTPGSSRPASALGGAFRGAGAGAGDTVSKGGQEWEAFKGKGETLTGRKTKGKGISVRKIEDQQLDSKIYRTGNKIVSNNTLQVDGRAPAALRLPFGRLFFGYNYVPYVPPPEPEGPKSPNAEGESSTAVPFSGTGNSLSGPRSTRRELSSLSTPAPTPKPEPPKQESKHEWGNGGVALGTKSTSRPAVKSTYESRLEAAKKKAESQKERSPTPDYGVDDDDVIEIDSD